MCIWLASTDTKRIDLFTDWNSTGEEIKERKFVITHGNTQRAFDDFLEAVDYYKGII